MAAKGGVYGVTRGLHDRFGAGAGLRHAARRADRPRHRARHRPGGVPAGARDPVPRLPAQRRGPAARRGRLAALLLRPASTPTAWSSGSPGWPTRRASAATSTTTTRWRCCATSRAIVVAVASHPHTAPALLRGCLDLARDEGRVCVFVEPIARYHTRDLLRRRRRLAGAVRRHDPGRVGDVVAHGGGRDLLMVTFGNGVLHEPAGGRGAARRGVRLHGRSTSRGWRRCPSTAPGRRAQRRRRGARRRRDPASGGVSEGGRRRPRRRRGRRRRWPG